MLSRLEVRHASWQVQVLPELGGAIGQLRWQGTPILRDAPADIDATRSVRHCANYPLLPYSNRIAFARFDWRGEAFALARNFGASPHALHGVGWQVPWQVTAADAETIVLGLSHRPHGAAARAWPFAFEAEQRFFFHEDAFVQSIFLRNVDECSMPAGIGYHPWFARRAAMRLGFASAGAWTTDADELPRERVAGGVWDFSGGRPLEQAHVDHDFFGWNGRAEIREAQRRIVLEADPVFGHLVVYTPEGRDYFAVEPVSHRRNAVNAANPADFGLRSLQPGESITGAIRFRVLPP